LLEKWFLTAKLTYIQLSKYTTIVMGTVRDYFATKFINLLRKHAFVDNRITMSEIERYVGMLKSFVVDSLFLEIT